MENHRGLYKFTGEPKVVQGKIWFLYLGEGTEKTGSFIASSLYSKCLLRRIEDVEHGESPADGDDLLIIPEEML